MQAAHAMMAPPALGPPIHFERPAGQIERRAVEPAEESLDTAERPWQRFGNPVVELVRTSAEGYRQIQEQMQAARYDEEARMAPGAFTGAIVDGYA